MTCYPVLNPKTSPTALWDVFGDALVGPLVTIPVSTTKVKYLCSPGAYFVPSPD